MNKQCPTSDRDVTAKAKGVGEYQRTICYDKSHEQKMQAAAAMGHAAQI